jgi:hypothetical protein
MTRHSVMAGLVPAIHVFAAKKVVDARDKRGHGAPQSDTRKERWR